MAHLSINGDLGGVVFTVDHVGDLYRNEHQGSGVTGPMRHAGLGVRVGTGWGGIRRVVASREGDLVLLAGIGAASTLMTTTAPAAAPAPGAQIPAPKATTFVVQSPATGSQSLLEAPTLRSLFASTGGVLFLTTTQGALLQLQFARGATTPSTLIPDGNAQVIDQSGWDGALEYFTNGDGIFFEVTPHGILRYQAVAAGVTGPAHAAWSALPGAFSRYHHVFGGGPGTIYAVANEGALERIPYTVANGQVQLGTRRHVDVVATGLYPWQGVGCDVEGYCWPLSVTAGERIAFHVGVRLSLPPDGVEMQVADPARYTVQLCRLRRMHDGVEANYDVLIPTPLDGESYTAPRYDLPADLLTAGAGWAESFALTVPDLPDGDANAWPSGLYAVRLRDTSGRDYYVSFVVRPRAPRAPFAMLANTNTWNTYNAWGGYGKYSHSYPVPETLPFLRPFPGLTPDVAGLTSANTYGLPVLDNSCHLLRAELWVQGWLQDQGADYAYDLFTDQDLQEGRTGIGDAHGHRYTALILNTHPEYWTRRMYDRVRAYVEQGGSIIYLGGNGIYEEVTLSENGQHLGIFPGLDRARFPASCTNEQLRLYCLMRSPAVGRPEHALLGVGFVNCGLTTTAGQPFSLAQDPSSEEANPVLAGVTVGLGGTLGAVSVDQRPPADTNNVLETFSADGWEIDQRGFGTPPEGYAPNALLAGGATQAFSGEMLAYDTAYGGTTFAAASLNFGGAMVLDANLQRIVRNALDRARSRAAARAALAASASPPPATPPAPT